MGRNFWALKTQHINYDGEDQTYFKKGNHGSEFSGMPPGVDLSGDIGAADHGIKSPEERSDGDYHDHGEIDGLLLGDCEEKDNN